MSVATRSGINREVHSVSLSLKIKLFIITASTHMQTIKSSVAMGEWRNSRLETVTADRDTNPTDHPGDEVWGIRRQT